MKEYKPEKLITIIRYRNYIPNLSEDIKRDIYARMQKHGKSEEESYKITSEEMWKALTPKSYQKMARLPCFIPM